MPTKRCIAPRISENTKSVIGSFTGSNHTGFMAISFPKATLPNTAAKSPNTPPNIMPQNIVDIPQYIKSVISFFISPSRRNFLSSIKHATESISPYPASESIRPKNMK